MSRIHQVVLIASTLALSWFAMMAVHESGHVFAALATGGTVDRVVLHPLTISRTDVSLNPHPLFVIWCGPLFGIAAPVLAWLMAQLCRLPIWFLLRFFAGFCLIANGAYLGIGSFDAIGDAGDLLRHGTPIWLLWIFGAICVPAGFRCWHGLGPHFGLGPEAHPIDIRVAYGCVTILVLVVIVMTIWGGE